MTETTSDTGSGSGLLPERYQLVKQVGSGGMGCVYLVNDKLLDNEQVALKLLHRDLCRNQKQIARFTREVQLTRKVTHPNVVRTFDLGSYAGSFYYTMEYAEGQNLHELFSQECCPATLAAQIMLEACRGLNAIHEAGIVHRDLKPGNIMITTAGLLKITDFGIARPFSSDLTEQHEIVGSAPYMAPEVWLGRDINCQADLYSLGILIYELITNSLPFDGESAAEVMCKHLELCPVPPQQLRQELPQWLGQLVIAMLQKDPSDRPASAIEVATLIELQLGANCEQIDFNRQYFNQNPRSLSKMGENWRPLSTGQAEHPVAPFIDPLPAPGNYSSTPPQSSLLCWTDQQLTPAIHEATHPTQSSHDYAKQYKQSLSALAEMAPPKKISKTKRLRKVIITTGQAFLLTATLLSLLLAVNHYLLAELLKGWAQHGLLGFTTAFLLQLILAALLVSAPHCLIATFRLPLVAALRVWITNGLKISLIVVLVLSLNFLYPSAKRTTQEGQFSQTQLDSLAEVSAYTVFRAALLVPPYSSSEKLGRPNPASEKLSLGIAQYQYFLILLLVCCMLHSLAFAKLTNKREGSALLLMLIVLPLLLWLQLNLLQAVPAWLTESTQIELKLAGFTLNLTVAEITAALLNWLALLLIITFTIALPHQRPSRR